MKNELVYLKPNVVIEPLFDRWYAWSHLISPATAAMNIVGRHLKIMNSYIQAPEIHAAAVKNPKMRGGPFMDQATNRREDVIHLRDKTIRSQKELIEMAAALTTLDNLLKSEARGFTLETLYEKVPDILKGYIELVYDLNNNPSYRIYESLLYNSKFYRPESQSLALWLTTNDERPFVLSTPRLDSPDVLHLDLPFSHSFIDTISKMKRTPQPFSEAREMITLTEEQEPLFEQLFTTGETAPYQKYEGNRVRMRYFGHACILVETKDTSILLDPLISYYGYQSNVARFSDFDLPDHLDYILITHNHQDHILFETLLPLRHKIKKIVVPATTSGALQDPNLKLMFENLQFNHVTEITDMQSLRFSDCVITGIPFIGEHSDLNVHSKICHHVRIGELSMLFVADSCNVEPKLYEHIHNIIGDVDVIFLGMECDGAPLTWLYGPLLTEELARDKDHSRRLAGSNFERGKALVDTFNPLEVYVYAMGQEPWLEFISSIKYTDESNPIIASNKLIAYCKNKGIIAERLFGEKEILYSKDVSRRPKEMQPAE